MELFNDKEQEELKTADAATVERPIWFSILCGLSMVAGLFGMLSSIASYAGASIMLNLNANEMEEEMKESIAQLPSFLGQAFGEQMMELLPIIPTLSLFNGIMYLLTFIGALLMFRFKKAGFHVYTAAKILEVFAPLVIAGPVLFSSLSMLICAVFILAYSRFLGLMK